MAKANPAQIFQSFKMRKKVGLSSRFIFANSFPLSSLRRRANKCFSSGVKNFVSSGQSTINNLAMIEYTMVARPSMTKILGFKLADSYGGFVTVPSPTRITSKPIHFYQRESQQTREGSCNEPRAEKEVKPLLQLHTFVIEAHQIHATCQKSISR